MDIFEKAKPTRKPETKSKSNDKATLNIEGLDEYSIIDATMKTLKPLGETAKEVVNEKALEQFVAEATMYGKRPQNFRGTDEKSSASIELRKRSSASGLSDEEAAILDKHNVPFEEIGDVVETFIFNPEALTQENMKKIAKALESVKGLPENIIEKQVAKKKRVVSDETLDAVFMKKDEETLRELIPIVCTQAVKATVTDYDPVRALQAIAEMLMPGKTVELVFADKDEVRDVFGKAKAVRSEKAKKKLAGDLVKSLVD